jgi:hypothetical protein
MMIPDEVRTPVLASWAGHKQEYAEESGQLGTPREWMIAWAIMWEELARARACVSQRLESEHIDFGPASLMVSRFPTAFTEDGDSLVRWCESHIIKTDLLEPEVK